MRQERIFVAGMGMISPLGDNVSATLKALYHSDSGLGVLTRFTAPYLFPVGEVKTGLPPDETIPRTHQFALAAALEAVKGQSEPPESIIIGVTTGGMPLTEEQLRRDVKNPAAYRYHVTSSIPEYIAKKLDCRGPVWTVSTACSSGAVALALGLELLRSGRFRRVLAGGVDALCRLTYHGFHALQLLDSRGPHPFDFYRKGLSLSEGAAMLLLVSAEHAPAEALAELAGAGLSCDAWHPTAPHPEGSGALKAMDNALRDAGVLPTEVDHINLHGTATPDNDIAEARAISQLFGEDVPPVASVKGALGHPLAAAGAFEAVISVGTLLSGKIPPTLGFETPDPALNIQPTSKAIDAEVKTVLSNSFGFGGNNAALVLRRCEFPGRHREKKDMPFFAVLGESCLTGAGELAETLVALEEGKSCQGQLETAMLSLSLDSRTVRRLKRLSRMALTLASSACPDQTSGNRPDSVFFGSGWGTLSETHDFLARLFETGDRFSSPADFIGSVHNAPAGQVGIEFTATGPNVTMTGGEATFEQALAGASLLAGEDALLVMGADEYHPDWSPLFDLSAVMSIPSDGGGALWLKRTDAGEGLRIRAAFHGSGKRNGHVVDELADVLSAEAPLAHRFAAVMAGLPAAQYRESRQRLDRFLALTGFYGPVIDYRRWIGEFASASAVAAVLAVSFARKGEIPASLNSGRLFTTGGRGILVLGLGDDVSAVEILS